MARVNYDPPMVFVGAPDTPEFIDKIRNAAPTAVVCSNDTTALLLLRGLQDAGIEIPRDIKLIGVDDVEIASQSPVPLSTVRQPCREIGAVATHVMVRRIEKRKTVACTLSLAVELVVRESCGAGQESQSE